MIDNAYADDEIFGSLLDTKKAVDFDSVLDKKVAHLSDVCQTELKTLIKSFTEVISDKPGCAHDFVHKIRIKPDAQPVRQKTYRMSP